jgi:GntR family transcriptional regulator
VPSDLAAPDDRRRPWTYQRVADDIAARIESGELPPGQRLRSERELATYYQVAYTTQRKAMAVLRERRLIETVHGSGTYVREDIAGDQAAAVADPGRGAG